MSSDEAGRGLLLITRRSRSSDIERVAHPLFRSDLTPQAAAAHRRSAAARLARHHRTWGFLAEVVPAPPSLTLAEHREAQRLAAHERWRKARSEWARGWCEARARLRMLPRARALELLTEWNTREDGACGPDELVRFLAYREPAAETEAYRRECRLRNAREHRKRAIRDFSGYVVHVECPGGELGTAELDYLRKLRCILCDQAWTTRSAFLSALDAGVLHVVDCRLAEQLPLL